MGLIFGLIKRLIKWSLYLAVFAAIIVLIPNLPPYSDFTSIPLEPTQPREGSLAPNNLLNNAKKLYNEKLLGPEAFQLYNGEVYTSLGTGEIVKLSPGGHVTFVTKIGQPCKGRNEEDKCGRPLDFKIDEKNQLIVADAYYGIWKVDLKTDKKQLLVSPHVEIEGRLPRIFNGITLDKNGDLFWTDSCSDFGLKDGAYCILTDPSGRLFHYNAAKNSSKVLVDNLWFANGLAVSPDRQFVVVAETAAYRLVKHYINGPKKGRTEEFVAGLPGAPDNVRVLPDGSGVLVGLYTVFDEAHPLITRSLAQTPLARKFLARMQRLAEIPFEFLNAHFPHVIFQDILYNIGSFKGIASLSPPMAGLLHVDWNGKMLASYFNTDDTLAAISDAVVVGDQLYIGAPHHAYIGAVPAPPALKKAFTSQQKTAPKSAPVKEEPKKTEPIKPAAAKPVKTESPKPTPKPVETKPSPKPVETKPSPKPVETKPTPKPVETKPTSKPVETKPTPKPVETKPTPKATQPPKQAEKPTTPSPTKVETSTTPPPKKVEKPTTTTPKPAETKPKVAPKPTEPKEDKAKKSTEPEKKRSEKKLPEQIPVEEKIILDTAKPKKESLKVIKKEGPAEIPNHS